jgi:hypothetical protein
MPLISLSIKHGRTLDDARGRLEKAVNEARTTFGPLVQRVDWSADRGSVRIAGSGFVADMRVDAEHVHVAVDVAILGGLLGDRLVKGLTGVVQRGFGQLPGK